MGLRYWAGFTSLIAGSLVMLWNGVPMYRKFLSGEPDPGHRAVLWALAVLLLIQPAFWTVRRIRPAVTGPWVIPGHLVLFFGRMTFVFVSGVFSAVFYSRMGAMEATPVRATLLVAVLFSMFCVTLEVERLAQAMIHGRTPPGPEPGTTAGKGGGRS